MILWILLLLAQETHHGMPTPVMEPPQSAPRVMRPDVREYRLAAVMAVPDTAERERELQEEWEDCFDADPVMEKYPMCQKR